MRTKVLKLISKLQGADGYRFLNKVISQLLLNKILFVSPVDAARCRLSGAFHSIR